MEIGSKVRITVGDCKGREGIYGGTANNSNWLIVRFPDGSCVHVNLDEIEEV